MKKALLLLVFLLSFTTYGQMPPGLLDPYNICEDGTIDGYATFNLVSTDPIGMLGLDPNIYTVTFHPSVGEANDNSNTIANPTAYINAVPYYQIIGIRFLNTSTLEATTSGMELGVTNMVTPAFSSFTICSGDNNATIPTVSLDGYVGTWSPPLMNNVTSVYTFTPNPGQCATTTTIVVTVAPPAIAYQGSLSFCDPTAAPLYDLSTANTQITGGDPNSTVTYFLTLADAQNNTNPLENSFTPTINPGTQVLYTRVTNPSGCYNISTLTLFTENCNSTCTPPTQLAATTTNLTSVLLEWNSTTAETTIWEIYITLEGQPAPTPLSDGTVVSVNPCLLTGLIPGECYAFYVRSYCNLPNYSGWSDWSAPKTTCNYDGGCDFNTCYSAGLMAFLDTNNNGTKEPNELPFYGGHYEYQINDSGIIQYGYPTATIAYFTLFDSNPANSYDISYVLNDDYSNYYHCTATQNNVILTNLGNAAALPFAVTQIEPFTDALVNSYPTEQPRPGFTYTTVFSFKNNSSSTIASGNLTFTKDASLSLSSISGLNGVVTTANGFTYAFADLLPNQSIFFSVTFTVPSLPTVAIGQLVTNTLSVQVANDAIATNDTTTLTQAIIGSYDPNNLIESHGEKIIFNNFSANDYLYYTVNFENTGSAAAQFVRVENTVDTKLDEHTFEMLDANYSVNTLRNGNQLTWRFYDINLPPTASNPINSHGYISYRIKPKPGYALGDIIPSTASIFFDTNPAIVTNTFNTEFVQALQNPSFIANTITLYPNPASNSLQITNSLNEPITNVALYEVSGKLVKQLTETNQSQLTVDLQNLAKGLYFVEITTAPNTKQIKKLIIR